MAIEVEYGDTIVEFPDGTPNETIKTAMQKLHAKSAATTVPPVPAMPTPQTLAKAPELPMGAPAADATGFGSHDIRKEVPKVQLGGPTLVDQLLPRTAEVRAKGGTLAQDAGAYALDIASLPGRGIASLPEAHKGAEAYLESVSDRHGKRFVGQVLRSPATAAAAVAAPFTGGMSMYLPYLAPAAAATATGQLEKQVNETQGDSIAENALAATGETVLGAVAGKAGEKVAGVAGNYLVKKANEMGANKLFKLSVSSNKELNSIPKEVFKKYEIRGPIDEASQHVSRLVDEGTSKINQAADALTNDASSPLRHAKFRVKKLLDNTVEKKPGLGPEYEEALVKVRAAIDDIAPDGKGNLDFKQMLDLRRALANLRDFDSANPKPISKKVSGKFYNAINDEFERIFAEMPKDTYRAAIEGFRKGDEIVVELMPVKSLLAKKAGKIAQAQENSGVLSTAGKATLNAVKNPLGTIGSFLEGAGGMSKSAIRNAESNPEITHAVKNVAGDIIDTRKMIRAEKLLTKGYEAINKITDTAKKNAARDALTKRIEKEFGLPFKEQRITKAVATALSTGKPLREILESLQGEEK